MKLSAYQIIKIEKCNNRKERSDYMKEVTALHVMKAFRNSRKHLKIFKILLTILIMLSFSVGFVGNNATTVKADNAKSMLDVAKAFGSFGGDYIANSSKYGKNYNAAWKAWNYIGPGDNSVLSQATKGSKTATYNALSSADSNFKDAAQFEEAMNQAGFDHPVTGSANWLITGARYVGAIIIIIALIATLGGQLLIRSAINIMSAINPFVALQYLVTNTNQGFAGQKGGQISLLKPLMDVLRPIYSSLSSIGAGIIYLGFCIGILTVLSNSHFGAPSQASLGKRLVGVFLKYFRGIMIVGAGPLLIGIIATNMMQSMKNDTNIVTDISTKQVYGNIINFDGWVNHSRLAFPSPNKSDNSSDDPDHSFSNKLNSNGSSTFDTSYIYRINTDGAGDSIANALNKQTNTQSKASKSKNKFTFGYESHMVSQTVGFIWDKWANYSLTKSTDYDNRVGAFLRPAAKSINDQKKSTQYGHKLSQDKGNMGNGNALSRIGAGLSSAKDGTMAFISGMIDHTNGHETDFSKDPYGIISLKNYSDDKAPQNGIANNGSLTFNDKTNTYSTDVPSASQSATMFGNKYKGGLSTLGMYNYLNTRADGTGITYTQPWSFVAFGGGVNQHASAGFVGRGMLFLGNFVKMISIMATSAMMTFIVAWIIIEGALTGVPRVMLYAINLASGRWRGLIGVFKELIGMFVRIFVGQLIIYSFQSVALSLDSALSSMLTQGMGAATIVPAGNKLMPFMISTFLLGVIRLFAGVLICVLGAVMVKNFRNITQFSNEMFKRLSDALGRFGMDGSKDLGIKSPDNTLPSSSANSNNNSQRGESNRDGNNSFNNLNPDNNAQNLDKDHTDPALDDQPKGFVNGLKSQLGMSGLDAADKFDNSKAGQAIKKGLGAVGAAVGGSKLGKAFGINSRGQGRQLPEKLEKAFRKNQAALANPYHVNNSNSAGLTKAEQQKKAAERQNKKDQMPRQATKDAIAKKGEQLAQGKKHLAKYDKNGRPKDASKMAGDMQEMVNDGIGDEKMQEAVQKQNEQAEKVADQYKKNPKTGKTNMVDVAEKNLQQKKQDWQKAAQEEQQAKRNAEKYPTDEKAQRDYKHAQAKTKNAKQATFQAKDQLHKAKVVSNAGLRNKAIAGSGKQVGIHGENLKRTSASEQQAARNRQFTHLTGKKALGKESFASKSQIAQARRDHAEAQAILHDPKQSASAKAQARKTLHDSNVVLQSGYQYGKYGNPAVTGRYQNATAQQKAQADKNALSDSFTAQTGYNVDDKAQSADPATKTYSERLANAQNMIDSGQVQQADGTTREATNEELNNAVQQVSADPAHQVGLIRNQMVETGDRVLNQAQTAGDKAVAQAPDNATTDQLNTIRSEAMDNYMQQDGVKQQLSSAGFNTGSVQEIHEAQHFANMNRAAVKSSLAPIQQTLDNGYVQTDSNSIANAVKDNYNNMEAAPELVTDEGLKHHVTNAQWHKTAQVLMDSYNSHNEVQLNKAKAYAVKNHMPMHIVNDPRLLSSAIAQQNSEQDSITQTALSYANANSTTPLNQVAEIQKEQAQKTAEKAQQTAQAI